jgi:hypothetical protein
LGIWANFVLNLEGFDDAALNFIHLDGIAIRLKSNGNAPVGQTEPKTTRKKVLQYPSILYFKLPEQLILQGQDLLTTPA